jgi:hypothetical protein
MDFREMGVPEACYFGCPSTDFRALEVKMAEAETAFVAARESGDSATRMQTLRDYGGTLQGIGQELREFPDGADGPWRATVPEGATPAVRAEAQTLRCCHYAGIVIVGAEKPVTLDRPDR